MKKNIHSPTAHDWRRGGPVRALRSGVSETSVRAAAAWSSGAMVARYTSAFLANWQSRSFKGVGDRGVLQGFSTKAISASNKNFDIFAKAYMAK